MVQNGGGFAKARHARKAAIAGPRLDKAGSAFVGDGWRDLHTVEYRREARAACLEIADAQMAQAELASSSMQRSHQTQAMVSMADPMQVAQRELHIQSSRPCLAKLLSFERHQRAGVGDPCQATQ